MLPILTALTGWLSVQLAAYLFFNYALPRRRQAWTAALAKKVSTEFFDPAVLEQKIADPANYQKIQPMVEIHVDDFLRKGLPKAFPIIGSLIGDRTINQLKEIFLKELETIFPVVMQGYVKNLQEELNLERMIAEKIDGISRETVQTAAYQAIGNGLTKVAALAAALGLLIGLGQLAIVMSTVTY